MTFVPITVTISGRTPEEVRSLILEMADTLVVKHTQITDSVSVSTVDVSQATKKADKVKSAKAVQVEEITPETEVETVSTKQIDEVTLDVVEFRKRVTELVGTAASNRSKVKETLDKFGFKSLTDVADKSRMQFLNDLQEAL